MTNRSFGITWLITYLFFAGGIVFVGRAALDDQAVQRDVKWKQYDAHCQRLGVDARVCADLWDREWD